MVFVIINTNEECCLTYKNITLLLHKKLRNRKSLCIKLDFIDKILLTLILI